MEVDVPNSAWNVWQTHDLKSKSSSKSSRDECPRVVYSIALLLFTRGASQSMPCLHEQQVTITNSLEHLAER